MHHLDMMQRTQELDDKIKKLADRISTLSSHRLADGVYDANDLSRQCSLICERLAGEQKVHCIKRCTRPVVPVQRIQAFQTQFPYDVKRLQNDIQLSKHFERHQLAASDDMIPDTPAEAAVIVELYTMPIAAVLLPEEAWARSLRVMKSTQHDRHRRTMVDRWSQRKADYPADAWKELTRKLERNDKQQ